MKLIFPQIYSYGRCSALRLVFLQSTKKKKAKQTSSVSQASFMGSSLILELVQLICHLKIKKSMLGDAHSPLFDLIYSFFGTSLIIYLPFCFPPPHLLNSCAGVLLRPPPAAAAASAQRAPHSALYTADPHGHRHPLLQPPN